MRAGRSDNGYRLGNAYEASAWVARQLTGWASFSAGLRGDICGNVHDSDPELATTFEQTMDPALQGGKRLNVFFGTTLHPCCDGFFKRQQLFVQGDVPIVQSLNGPQLQASWRIQIGWQRDF